MAPLILSQPQPATAKSGQTVTLRVQAAAIPEASCQWFKNGKPLRGATGSTLTLKNVSAADSGDYTATLTNGSGTARSDKANIKVD